MKDMYGENKKELCELTWEQRIRLAEEDLKQKGYRGITVVGQGAFSIVFRMWDNMQKCYWACKVSVLSQMAEREAEMLRNMQHPIFPKYKASWQRQGFMFLQMEYIFGYNIRELCKRRTQFTQGQAVQIALELARGIAFLHERDLPVLFRDIKPENVMIRQDGRVKLVDMGCAVLQNESTNIAGSLGYSAPEQFSKLQKIGKESDVYALGRLLLFLLTGQESNWRQEERKMIEWGKGISSGLKRLVKQATKLECQRRIPDMRIFEKRLSIYEEKSFFKRGFKNIKSSLFCEEIVDFYYIQNIRRGIDNKWKM